MKNIFRHGLKQAIKLTGMTQMEFCKTKVTSTVNLSKILNGNTGTSERMREKLAERTGTTVDKIMKLGKDYLAPLLNENNVEVEKNEELSASEAISKVITKNADIIEFAGNAHKLLISANEAIQKKDDDYIEERYQWLFAMKAFNFSIKIINPELKITKILADPNSYFSDNLENYDCKMPRRETCNNDCLAPKILSSQKVECRIFQENACMEIGFPHIDNGKITNIYIVMIPLESDIVSIFKALALSNQTAP